MKSKEIKNGFVVVPYEYIKDYAIENVVNQLEYIY